MKEQDKVPPLPPAPSQTVMRPPMVGELLIFPDGVYQVAMLERDAGDIPLNRPPEIIVRLDWVRRRT